MGPPVTETGPVEEFRAYLRDHNLPVTAQRIAIADVVLGSDRHLSADECLRDCGVELRGEARAQQDLAPWRRHVLEQTGEQMTVDLPERALRGGRLGYVRIAQELARQHERASVSSGQRGEIPSVDGGKSRGARECEAFMLVERKRHVVAERELTCRNGVEE